MRTMNKSMDNAGLIGVKYLSESGRVSDMRICIPNADYRTGELTEHRSFLSGPLLASLRKAVASMPDEVVAAGTRERIGEMMRSLDCDAVGDEETVLSACDGVYKNGRLVETETCLLIPNDFVIDAAGKDGRTVFGASVHPYRTVKDMMDETDRCIGEGADFFTWLPSAQQIDPEDERCIPFYLRLAGEGLPLLCCSTLFFIDRTPDFSLNRYNDPARLRKALDIGLRVIAAHCVSPYRDMTSTSDTAYFDKLLEMLRKSGENGWDLRADISAFCSPKRIAYLEAIREEVTAGRIPQERFVHMGAPCLSTVEHHAFKTKLDLDGIVNILRELKTRGELEGKDAGAQSTELLYYKCSKRVCADCIRR